MRLREIVFDCERPAELARFWTAALDGFEVRPYDDSEIARLAALGLTPETDPSVMVDSRGLSLCFQQNDSDSGSKNKVHLDLTSDDRRGDVERLLSAGGSIVETFERHTWLRDPEGNDFCITDAH